MKLKTFGCSFIFGSELSDCGKNGSYNNGSYLTWPFQLSKHLGYSYECHARPGAGNLQIAERVLSRADATDPSLFVIGWTWIDRYDCWDPTETDNWTEGDLWNNWSTVLPSDTTEKSRVYYRDLQAEFRDKLTSLITIRTVIDTLNQKKIPFIMTYMDGLLFDHQWHVTPAVIELQNYVKPFMTTFDGMTFLEWSRKNNFPVSNAWHPLEQAHQAGFELIKNQSFS